MKQIFLFQPAPDPAWSRGRRFAFWLWNVALVSLAAVGIGLVSLLLALGPYSLGLARTYLERPVLLALNLLPVVGLGLLCYGLTRSASRSFLLTAVVVLGFSVANYYKLMFRDDPLMFADLFLLKEAGNMAGKYRLFLDGRLGLGLVCAVGGYLFLRLLVRGRPARRSGLACTLALAGAALLGLMAPILTDSYLYNIDAAYYDRLNNRWSATQQYLAHGFVYPFVYSVTDAFETAPDGYDKQTAAALLAAYEDADIPEEKKVNVVAIMLEAYNDFTKFGTPQLAQDVYAVWHQLEAEGYSGDLVTNIFAGGTVDTERCFLTGYSTLTNFRGNTNSYPWYFRSQGYTVEGMHPCFQWFYNRLNINSYLGFETYAFVDNYFAPLTGGDVGLDDVFFPELLKAYQAGTAGDKPYFNFSVTYQGHGPYTDDRCWWGERGDFVVDDGTYTDSQQYILDNYFGSIANTNQHLKELTDYFRNDDEPVVLVLFGDHNPWMGDGNSVYTAMGLDFDLDSQKGFFDYYATRYLIWANDAAKAALGCDFQGEGPAVGPSFLMNQLFQLCGWEGPAYLQAAGRTAREVSVVHTSGRYLEDGVLTARLSPENAALVGDYKCLQYYWRNHFAYSSLLKKD